MSENQLKSLMKIRIHKINRPDFFYVYDTLEKNKIFITFENIYRKLVKTSNDISLFDKERQRKTTINYTHTFDNKCK